MRKRLWGFILFGLVGLIGMSLPPTLAAPAPRIQVNPVWRPQVQLTTIDANGNGVTDPGDDIRYAVVDIYATVNVEFWGVGFICTVNNLAVENYTPFGDPNSADTAVQPFRIGSSWN